MHEQCLCGQNKIRTEVDGRFVYQVCDICEDVINIVYLGPKEQNENVLEINEEMLGL